MNTFVGWTVIALVAGAVAVLLGLQWLRYRSKLDDMQRQLAWSEASRFAAEAEAQASEARLRAASAKAGKRKPAVPFKLDDLPVVNRAASAPGAWADTQPMSADLAGFKPTAPARLSE